MARVLYGSEVTALKGSIGGTTFQRNPSGEICRLKPRRSMKNTPSQQLSIIQFSYLSSLWRVLSLANQQAWIAFADAHVKYNHWGSEKTLTGLNWYISCNAYRLLMGDSVLSSPPGFITVPAVPSFSSDPNTGNLNLVFDEEYEDIDYWLFIYSSGPLRQPSQANRKSLRLITIYEPDTFSTINLSSAWEAYFGLTWPMALSAGAYYIFLAACQVDEPSGLSSIFTTSIGSLRVI